MALCTAGWLSSTAPVFQDAVLAQCQWRSFGAAETISHGGDTSGGMFGIALGSFSALPAVGAADTPIIHIGSGPFWYGTNPLNHAVPRSMSVVTRSPCIVASIPQHALLSLLADDPAHWRYFFENVSEILALVSQIATDLILPDSLRRCIAVLLRVAGSRNSGMAPTVAEMTQDELAGMANMSRQTTGAIVRRLSAKGLVTVGYRNIIVNDPAALRTMLAG